jgi:hypothetical protein
MNGLTFSIVGNAHKETNAMLRMTLRAGMMVFMLAAMVLGSWQPGGAAPSPVRDLLIVKSDAGYATPSTLPAGRYRVTLENHTSRVAVADFIQMPDGATSPAFLATMTQAIDDSVADLLVPSSAPLWLRDIHFAGGPAAAAWGSGQTVIDLTAGEWLVMAFGAGADSPSMTLTVTGEATITTDGTPVAAADLVLADGIHSAPSVTRSGRQLWRVINEGEEARGLILVRLNESGIGEVPRVTGSVDLTPGLSMLPAGAGGAGLIGPGATIWVSLHLEPGRYALVTYSADPGGIVAFGDAAMPVVTAVTP